MVGLIKEGMSYDKENKVVASWSITNLGKRVFALYKKPTLMDNIK